MKRRGAGVTKNRYKHIARAYQCTCKAHLLGIRGTAMKRKNTVRKKGIVLNMMTKKETKR